MNLSGSMLVTALGLALLQAGCLGADGDVDAWETPLADELNDPTGSTGSNGCGSEGFHGYKFELYQTTTMPILDQNGLLNATATGIFGTLDGVTTFKYAMRCALPTGTTVSHGTNEYRGYGMLNSTTQWLSTPLGAGAKADLFACMAAHVNPSGMEVKLRLTGRPVPNQGGDVSEFGFQEAVWRATVDPSGEVAIDVWPLPDLVGACGPLTSDSLRNRVCGTFPGACGLTVRNDFETACAEGSGGLLCDGKHVIKSWLRADDVPLLHLSGCVVP